MSKDYIVGKTPKFGRTQESLQQEEDEFNARWDKEDPEPSNIFRIPAEMNLEQTFDDSMIKRAMRWLNKHYMGKHGSWQDAPKPCVDAHFNIHRSQYALIEAKLEPDGKLTPLRLIPMEKFNERP